MMVRFARRSYCHVNERTILMTKTPSTKKMMKFMLALAAAFVIFFALGMSASAASYPAIKLNVPRVSQCPGRGDCAIASMATIEAYCHELPSGNHNSTAYQAVYSANGNSVSATWSKLGYKPIEGFDMKTLYNQLKTGYPVIVRRSSPHYSVVYGYDGNSSKLELSGFLIVDVDDSYSNTSALMRLDKWQRGSLDRMVIRQNGLAISTSGIRITNNHPAQNTAKGESFTPYGMIVSGSNITSVTVTVATASGTTKQTFSATPNAKSFALSKASDKINISSLTAGKYVYSIVAKNAAGKTDKFSFDFSIGGSSSTPTNPGIKEVSYKAIVNAQPSLNMRKGAGTDYEKIGEIPYGKVIDVTGEYNGWARVKYDGKTGWVSMEYISKYVAPDNSGTVPDVSFKSYLARSKSALALKEKTSIFSSTIESVPKNTIVKIVAESDGWVKYKYNGKTGWSRKTSFVTGLGDIDANNLVNSADALMVLNYSTSTQTLSERQKTVADMNGDAKVNAADALSILQIATGLKKV